MKQKGSKIVSDTASVAKCNAWNRYCENDWCNNDDLHTSFFKGFDSGLCWTHKELTWVLASKSKKELIERLTKVQKDIENFCEIK